MEPEDGVNSEMSFLCEIKVGTLLWSLKRTTKSILLQLTSTIFYKTTSKYVYNLHPILTLVARSTYP